MVSVNSFLPLFRTIVMIGSSLLGVAVLAMGAHIVSVVNTFTGGAYNFDYAALALATGLLTVLSLPAMLFISIGRKGAVTSMIVVELTWMSFLCIMWVASAGTTASTGIGLIDPETQAIEALAFIAWLLILSYTITLLICTVMANTKGRSNIWISGVRETDFTAPPVTSTAIVQPSHEVKLDNTGVAAPQSQNPPSNPGTFVTGHAATPPYPQV